MEEEIKKSLKESLSSAFDKWANQYYQKHIDKSKGTCFRYKSELSLERIKENKIKIKKAIEKISKDLILN